MPFQSSARGKFGPQSLRVIRGPEAPVWVSSGSLGTNVPQGQPYSLQLVATDDSGVAPTYTLASGSLPTGTTLSTSGLISGTPNTSGTFNFTVNATDENGRVTTSSTLSINVASSVPIPAIWYKNSSVGQNPVPNSGTLGSSWNASFTGSTTTAYSRNVWNLGSGYLSHPFTELVSSSSNNPGWTLAAVLWNSSNGKFSLIGSPTGSSQLIGSTGNAQYFTVIYNNDGYPFPGSSAMITNLNMASEMSQVTVRFETNGQLTVWGPNRSNGVWYSGNLSNGSGQNPYTSSRIDIERIGWSRGSQDPTWYLAEYMLWQRPLSDTEVTQVRTYLGATHPVGQVNN